MMNALYAMDELMGTNEININLPAITPAFLIASSVRYAFRKIYYALLKISKSKEETYASLRHIVLDIERLLVMRDDPPQSPPPLTAPEGYRGYRPSSSDSKERSSSTMLISSGDGTTSVYEGTLPPVVHHHNLSSSYILKPDDLGMLVLLVHECRMVLWQDRRRFTRIELQNVLEDLAELAGERGAVSVRQQLRIIARMCRTYSFLKVVSSGMPFSISDALLR